MECITEYLLIKATDKEHRNTRLRVWYDIAGLSTDTEASNSVFDVFLPELAMPGRRNGWSSCDARRALPWNAGLSLDVCCVIVNNAYCALSWNAGLSWDVRCVIVHGGPLTPPEDSVVRVVHNRSDRNANFNTHAYKQNHSQITAR